MKFKAITSTTLFPDRILIEWKLDNPALNDDYLFDIYIKENNDEHFKKVTLIPLINQYYYILDKITLNKFPDIEFYIECRVYNTKIKSPINNLLYSLSRKQFLIAYEMIRKNELVRKLHNGVECEIYRRRTDGVLCECRDKVTGLIKKANCPKCYGTGFVGGYVGPLKPLWVEIYHNSYQVVPSEVGNIDQIVGQARLSRPLVNIGDIIVEKNRNYR